MPGTLYILKIMSDVSIEKDIPQETLKANLSERFLLRGQETHC